MEAGWRGETIEVWGKGLRRNQYTYFDDIAAGCVLGMERRNEIYNLISPEETSTAELARLVGGKFGFDVVFNEVQKEGPSLACMSPRKGMQQLRWVPTPLAEGIDRMARGAVAKASVTQRS
jgi:nucleoside-diphosphate-sugar epimerase